ncbi:hypothetical protein QBE54_05180 [Thermatribacter velox]|uniref:Transposase n=1 Tax=Thermatribacter velox TaxID=3039681 RepID=A0ABZ2YE72_9BACT|nr:putative transposase [Candidatus Atribacteria bacterium]
MKCCRKERKKLFAYLSLPYSWKQRVRTTNLGENFFKHLRTFLRRFPGLNDEEHMDYVMTTYLLSLETKRKAITRRDNPYQFRLIFNTGN